MNFERGQNIKDVLVLGKDRMLLNRIKVGLGKAYDFNYCSKRREIKITSREEGYIATWITEWVQEQIQEDEKDNIKHIYLTPEDVIIITLL